MQFWYNVNPNSPWMNRCGLTSGKKSLVTAQKSNNDSKNFFKKIKESSRETSWTEEPSLRCFQDKPSKKKKKKIQPPPNSQTRLAMPVTQTELFVPRSLAVFGASFLPPLLGRSRHSPLPPEAGLRLLRRPFLPPLAYTAS